MNKKDKILEATMLALQGKLEEKENIDTENIQNSNQVIKYRVWEINSDGNYPISDNLNTLEDAKKFAKDYMKTNNISQTQIEKIVWYDSTSYENYEEADDISVIATVTL